MAKKVRDEHVEPICLSILTRLDWIKDFILNRPEPTNDLIVMYSKDCLVLREILVTFNWWSKTYIERYQTFFELVEKLAQRTPIVDVVAMGNGHGKHQSTGDEQAGGTEGQRENL